MEKDRDKIIEGFFGKKVCTEKLNIEGIDKPMSFDIYDGYAICKDFKGHTYDMTFPQMKAIKDSEELSNAIIEFVDGVECVDDISPLHVLITFNTLYEDGIEIVSDEY